MLLARGGDTSSSRSLQPSLLLTTTATTAREDEGGGVRGQRGGRERDVLRPTRDSAGASVRGGRAAGFGSHGRLRGCRHQSSMTHPLRLRGRGRKRGRKNFLVLFVLVVDVPVLFSDKFQQSKVYVLISFSSSTTFGHSWCATETGVWSDGP